MDVAYDSIQKEALSPDEVKSAEGGQASDLNTEFREAYKAIASSPWAAKLGGWFGSVKKQGESYYLGARQELSAASLQASRGVTDLISNTNTLEINQTDKEQGHQSETGNRDITPTVSVERPESLPADIVKEAETILSRFRTEAAERLKQVQKAEDAADEALLNFGTNIRNFLRDAVTITAPEDHGDGTKRDVLFESKDPEGKRIVHATRFDAQLHVIHSNVSSFLEDPSSDQYKDWVTTFDVEQKTDQIAQDLAQHEELRRSMEKLVPEKVDYGNFWKRYYFLRHVIETEEQKRRELLKQTVTEDEDIDWGDDEEDEEHRQADANEGGDASPTTPTKTDAVKVPTAADFLKPNERRRSNEQSVADSDASYDIVSGATSRSPGSPKEERDAGGKRTVNDDAEDSDEPDWE